ncbi:MULTISPECIES: hypothetical protein [Burkholderia]|uniref:hypothetical protein n=1 Tax=Burkholderia TaxID=32008 RepID=UPI00158B7979|nr:hypothetical protein [Burkholderia ambifaria]
MLRNGRIVEQGLARDVVAAPKHKYTQRLLTVSIGRREPGAPVPEGSPVLRDVSLTLQRG